MAEYANKEVAFANFVLNIPSKIVEVVRKTAVADTQSRLSTTSHTPSAQSFTNN